MRSPVDHYDVIEEEDQTGDWIHDDDFYEFKEKFIRSLDEYTDKKGLISTKFVKIAFDRCEEVESRQVQVMY